MFSLDGILNRKEFLITFLVVTFGFGFISGLPLSVGTPLAYGISIFFIIIGVIIISFVAVQRLNDIGWNRWLTMLNFIPYINILFFIVLVFARGKDN